MKCQFCGKDAKKLRSGPNDIGLCDVCYDAYAVNLVAEVYEEEKIKATIIEEDKQVKDISKVEKVIDLPLDTEKTEEQGRIVKCELVIGVLDNNDIYFNIGGESTDLVTMEGLLQYAQRRIKQIWDARDIEIAKARMTEEAAKNKEDIC